MKIGEILDIANFVEKYEMQVSIITMSALGALHKESIADVKDNWIPDIPNPQGFLRALLVELTFATLRTLGMGVQIVQSKQR